MALYLNIPERAYDVAIGAVIEDVIPAQNNPIDIKYFEKLPRIGAVSYTHLRAHET